jgi:hypothetical protein
MKESQMGAGFTTFLLEDYSKKLSEESFLKALRTHCNNSHNAAKTSGLFTNFKGESDFLEVDPKDRIVRSAFMVDELIELLPSWKHHPFRRKALIGYTSLAIAQHYAAADQQTYILLPYDKGHLCMLQAESFYVGCVNACKTIGIKSLGNTQLRSWLSSLRRIAKMLGIKVTTEEPDTGKALLKAVQALDGLNDVKKVDELEKADEEDKDRARTFSMRSGSPLEFLSQALDPDNNRVEKLLAIHHNMPADREVWTNSPCLMISLEAYKRLHEAGKIK